MNMRTLLSILLIFPISIYSIQTYNQIRVLNGDDILTYTFNLTTDEKVTIKVEGQRRDNLTWEPVYADWSFPYTLQTDNILHEYDDENLVDPSAPFSGRVGIEFNDPGGATFYHPVKLNITPGIPTSVSISIIDIPDSVYTSDTISLLVKIYNKDGVFSNAVDHECSYSLQNYEGSKPTTFIINDSIYTLDPATPDSTISCVQSFTSGTDTIKVICGSPTSVDTSQTLIFSSQEISDSTAQFPIFDKPVSTYSKTNYIAKKRYNTPSIYMLNGKKIQTNNSQNSISENLYILKDHNNNINKALKSKMLQLKDVREK